MLYHGLSSGTCQVLEVFRSISHFLEHNPSYVAVDEDGKLVGYVLAKMEDQENPEDQVGQVIYYKTVSYSESDTAWPHYLISSS